MNNIQTLTGFLNFIHSTLFKTYMDSILIFTKLFIRNFDYFNLEINKSILHNGIN